MHRKIFILAFSIIVSITLPGQEAKINSKDKKCGCGFSSLIQVGILEGESGTAFELQTINGVRFGTWRVGIGVGLDYYKFRGIPLFLDLRKDILKKARTPFIYADGGIHFAWVNEENKTGWLRNEYSNGLYYAFGAGYRLGLKKNDAFVFSLGYSYKKMEEKRYSTVYCINTPCDERLNETLDYGLRRLSFQLGFNF